MTAFGRVELIKRLFVEAEEYLARGMLFNLLRSSIRLLRNVLKLYLST
jgi:hypothetical protein